MRSFVRISVTNANTEPCRRSIKNNLKCLKRLKATTFETVTTARSKKMG